MKPKATYRFVACCLFVLLGIFTLLAVQMPSKTGILGQAYYTSFLIPVLGHGSLLFSFYFIGCGCLILISSHPFWRLTAATLVVIPLLIWIDHAYITEVFPAQSFLNRLTESTIAVYIGNAGLLLLEIIFLVSGICLFWYKTRFSFPKRRSSKKKASSREKAATDLIQAENDESTGETPDPIDPNSPGGKPVKDNTAVEKSRRPMPEDPTAKRIELNLKPYRKHFVRPQLSDFKKQPADSVSYGEKKDKIRDVFASLGVAVGMGSVIGGPSVEQYEIIPGKGVKLAQVKKLEDDLSLALKCKVLITFNTQGSLCLEAPMAKRRTVFFRRLLESAGDIKAKLPVILGVNASYETYGFDLAELPHLLIAGTTGSGKSILIKTILASIMYQLTPNDIRLVMVDPKRVDFGIFNASPFMAYRVITDIEVASIALQTLVDEMELRYDILEQSQASNISLYNQTAKPGKQMPYIVAVIDEFADLIMADKTDIGDTIIRIAQKARACGIHLILATQRPSAEVISGLIKANVPGKIALSVSSAINSKIIIDRSGAEKLLGKGDMIFISPDVKDGIRLQGAYISDDEIMKFMKT